jgi:hypothetical protein
VINADKPSLWRADVFSSVMLYNKWFLEAAPKAYRDTRQVVVDDVEDLTAQKHYTDVSDLSGLATAAGLRSF